MTAAISATVLGPFAMWARLGMTKRPKLHRAFGYAWVTMMIVTAVSAIFIRSSIGLNWMGFSPIHLLVPLTFFTLFGAFRFLAHGNIVGHRKSMISLYIGACLVAGFFTLVPGRYLGDLLWK
jgi:uncharacterized membrane protein